MPKTAAISAGTMHEKQDYVFTDTQETGLCLCVQKFTKVIATA